MTTYYKKEGRRYVPTLEYDSDVLDAFAEGAHIVVCKPGHRMYKYKIQPEFAGLIAAGMYCRDAISSKVINSAQVRPVIVTGKQQYEDRKSTRLNSSHITRSFNRREKRS